MKKILLLAAIALFGISAYAQSPSKVTKVKGQDKEQTDVEKDDADVKLSSEEKAARKAEKRAGKEAEKAQRKASKEILKADRKADRDDDGIINESNVQSDSQGKEVSTLAKETTLKGREKGEAISTAARSKARNGEMDKADAPIKAIKAKRVDKKVKSKN